LNNHLLWSEFIFDLFFDSWYGVTTVRGKDSTKKGSFQMCVAAKHRQGFYDYDFLCSKSYTASDPWKFSFFFLVCKGNFAEQIQSIL